MAFNLSDLVKMIDEVEGHLKALSQFPPVGDARPNEEGYWQDLATAARVRLRDAKMATRAMQALSEGLDENNARSLTNGLEITLGALGLLHPTLYGDTDKLD